MLRIVKRFGKHCNYHLQGKCVVVGRFWKRKSGLLSRSTNHHHQIQPVTYCLRYIKLQKTPNHYTFTPKTTAMFAETFDNFQHSHPRKPKLHNELQPRKPTDKNEQ
jgi:hypothetical protein